jgi:hypothetical protein
VTGTRGSGSKQNALGLVSLSRKRERDTGELRDRSQFVFKATSLQTNQRVTTEVIHEREYLIPSEFWKVDEKFFKPNTLPLLNKRQ